jgi:cytochrome c-type biogenesis protein CcmH
LAAIAVLVPYARGQRQMREDAGSGPGGSDAEVYKDQLGEIERDVARGMLNEAEAEAARIEISRRLLKANDLDDGPSGEASAPTASKLRSGAVLATAFILVPAGALALYMAFGSPGAEDRPLADRLTSSIETQDAAILIARVEAALAENPDDARGWVILAPIYTRQGRFDEARGAYEQLLRIQGEDSFVLVELGELVVLENQGLVTQEAMGRFMQALSLDPTNPKARYYRALGLVQEGEQEEARAILLALRNDSTADAPWLGTVDALLDDMDGAARVPAPDAASAQAIADLSQQDQQAAIESMVASLAARLQDSPDDLEGWTRLVRSYTALDAPVQAASALAAALDHFEDDSPARQRLLTLAQELELDAQ